MAVCFLYKSGGRSGGGIREILKTALGTVIALTDSAYRPLRSLKVFGKTEQRTTTGKNFLNMESGSTQNGNIVYLDGDTVVIKPSTYVNYIVEVTAVKTENIVFSCDIVPETNALGLQIQINGINKVERDYTSAQKASYAFPVSTGDVITIKLRSPNGGSGKFKNCMIESGSTATAYEPYTGGKPSPSPEYPQELESVGDSVNVTVCGKNLMDIVPVKNITTRGVTFAPSEDGTGVKITGTSTEQWPQSGLGNHKAVDLPPGRYTLSMTVEGESSGEIGVYFNRDGTNYIAAKGEKSGSAIVEIEKGHVYKYFVYAARNNVTFNCVVRAMLVPGEVAAEWEPYKEPQTLPIATPVDGSGNSLLLPGIPVESGGNYTDPETGKQWICDEVDFEKGVYVQRVNRMDSWTNRGISQHIYTNENYFVAILNTGGIKTRSNMAFCTHLRSAGESSNLLKTEPVLYLSTAYNEPVHISVPTSIANTTEMLRTWLTDNKVVILYPMQEPVYRDLSAEELAQYAALHSNYPNTTVFNDQNAGMEVKYIAIGG